MKVNIGSAASYLFEYNLSWVALVACEKGRDLKSGGRYPLGISFRVDDDTLVITAMERSRLHRATMPVDSLSDDIREFVAGAVPEHDYWVLKKGARSIELEDSPTCPRVNHDRVIPDMDGLERILTLRYMGRADKGATYTLTHAHLSEPNNAEFVTGYFNRYVFTRPDDPIVTFNSRWIADAFTLVKRSHIEGSTSIAYDTRPDIQNVNRTRRGPVRIDYNTLYAHHTAVIMPNDHKGFIESFVDPAT